VIDDDFEDSKQQSLFPEEMSKVFMANRLARAEWHTNSVITERAVNEIVSQIGPEDKLLEKSYSIPVTALFPDPGGKDYEGLGKVAFSLTKEVVVVYEDYTKNSGTVYNIFRRSSFNEKKKQLKVSLNPDLQPFILALKEKFTVYKKLDFIRIPSRYSQRLFKLLKSWESEPQTQISITDLHRLLVTPKSCQTNYAQFDRKILAPAYTHITENTDLAYRYEPLKVGRKIDSVVFTFSKQRKIQKAPPKNKNGNTP
jgi:hypothetical protein